MPVDRPPIDRLKEHAIIAQSDQHLAELRDRLRAALLNRKVNAAKVDEILKDFWDIYGVILLSSTVAGWLSPWYPSLISIPPGPPGSRPDGISKNLAIDLKSWDFLNSALSWLNDQIGELPNTLAGIIDQLQLEAAAYGAQVDEATLQKINEALRESIASGESREEWSKRLDAILSTRRGFDETIGRTAYHRSMINGQRQVLEEPVIVDIFPYRKYLATLDDRVRDEHRDFNANIYHKDSPLAAEAKDLLDEYNCRCSEVPLTEEQAMAEGITPGGEDPRGELAVESPSRQRSSFTPSGNQSLMATISNILAESS